MQTTENSYFRKQIPGIRVARSTINSTIPENVLIMAQNMITERLKCAVSVTITMDIWSDRKMCGYLSITAHVLDHGGSCCTDSQVFIISTEL